MLQHFGREEVLLLLLGFLSVGTWTLTQARTGPTHDKLVVCYISTWSVYRPGHGAYSIEQFDANLCTHAIYAFAGLDIAQAAIKSLDPWQDLKVEYGKGGYERLTAFKRSHPHLKVILAIGGWNEGSANYSKLVANVEQRGRFVQQVTSFVRKYDFDGLDLDWEYPTQRDGKPADRENFVALVAELRSEFDKHNLLLTSAIGASKKVIDEAYDVRQLSRYLDFMHIMCYDYHGSWDNKVGFNAPLVGRNADDVLSVQYTIEMLLTLGAPPEKLVLGLPFYGRTFNTPFEARLDAATEGTGFQGPYIREDGFLGYNEICEMLSNRSSGWTTIWDSHASQMLAYSERDSLTGMTNVVTFDSERSIANKVLYAIRKKLAGLMIWSVDTDDFRGDCTLSENKNVYDDYIHLDTNVRKGMTGQRVNKNYALLRTINEAIPIAMLEAERARAADTTTTTTSMPSTTRHPTPDDRDNEIPTGTVDDHKGDSGATHMCTTLLLPILLMPFHLIWRY